MFYDCMGNVMPATMKPSLCDQLGLSDEELVIALAEPHSLMSFFARYFYERDILQVRKNEWLICIDGESAANTFDEMPITFKTKEDAVAWVHDNNEGCKVRFVFDDDDCIIMNVTRDRFYEKLGYGVTYAISILDEESHAALIRHNSEEAAKRVCDAFWNNCPMMEYAERLIRFYFECVRAGNLGRLSEINGADDAVPPKD